MAGDFSPAGADEMERVGREGRFRKTIPAMLGAIPFEAKGISFDPDSLRDGPAKWLVRFTRSNRPKAGRVLAEVGQPRRGCRRRCARREAGR